jgi:hypothetical protein
MMNGKNFLFRKVEVKRDTLSRAGVGYWVGLWFFVAAGLFGSRAIRWVGCCVSPWVGFWVDCWVLGVSWLLGRSIAATVGGLFPWLVV